MAQARFPSNPFWKFSVKVYARPGVASACLALQDELGLDVNMLLLCAWCGTRGSGRLPAETLRRCVDRVRPWQERVVRPLRELRRRCKSDEPAVPASLLVPFRSRLGEAELAAERVQQGLLHALVSGQQSGRPPRAAMLCNVCLNLAGYLAVLDLRTTQVDRRHLEEFLAGVFAEVPRADITHEMDDAFGSPRLYEKR